MRISLSMYIHAGQRDQYKKSFVVLGGWGVWVVFFYINNIESRLATKEKSHTIFKILLRLVHLSVP